MLGYSSGDLVLPGREGAGLEDARRKGGRDGGQTECIRDTGKGECKE